MAAPLWMGDLRMPKRNVTEWGLAPACGPEEWHKPGGGTGTGPARGGEQFVLYGDGGGTAFDPEFKRRGTSR
jgi:hypothetical protein